MIIRKCAYEDSFDLFKWRNDSSSRKASFSQEKILKEDHDSWFENLMHNKYRIIYIAVEDHQKLGMVRFDTIDQEVEIHVNLNPFFRGKGLSKKILLNSIKEFTISHYTKIIYAKCKGDNIASIKMFTGCGFIEGKELDGVKYLELTL